MFIKYCLGKDIKRQQFAGLECLSGSVGSHQMDLTGIVVAVQNENLPTYDTNDVKLVKTT